MGHDDARPSVFNSLLGGALQERSCWRNVFCARFAWQGASLVKPGSKARSDRLESVWCHTTVIDEEDGAGLVLQRDDDGAAPGIVTDGDVARAVLFGLVGVVSLDNGFEFIQNDQVGRDPRWMIKQEPVVVARQETAGPSQDCFESCRHRCLIHPSAQRTAVKQRPHQETGSCQVATSEPVVLHHGREEGSTGGAEVRSSASTACWAALATSSAKLFGRLVSWFGLAQGVS